MALAGGLAAPPLLAPPELDTGWLQFGDAYHVFSDHLPSGDGAAGPWVRRGYLMFDARYDENWFGNDHDPNPRWMGAVTWMPAPGWTLDPHAGQEAIEGPHQRATLQGFLAWRGKRTCHDHNDEGVRPKTDRYLWLTLFFNYE